jgi:hypothetical protein
MPTATGRGCRERCEQGGAAMRYDNRNRRGWFLPSAVRATALGVLLQLVCAAEADAIPAFARKYKVSCQLCHNPPPRLTEFGNAFAGNGFRFASAEPPRDTISTGDALLELAKDLPLALRMDIYFQGIIDGETSSDLQTPYNVKLLTGGTISKKLSYYLYFFLFERGEIGGIEDAYLYVNDIVGPLDILGGQFQVSDPMFKRELRLSYADYVIYRTRVGPQPADLTYDRGVSLIASPGGFTLTGTVVNGNGRGEAGDDRLLDDDPAKNWFAHATTSLTDWFRLGAMGYVGRQKGREAEDAPAVSNDLWMLGADATFTSGNLELNAQYIHREDDNATFVVGEPTAKTDGGFVEGIWQFSNDRWYVLGLWNYIYCNEPLLDVRLTGPSSVNRYNALTGGVGYVFRRNVRALAEATYDLEQEQARLTLGVVSAF